MPLALTILTPEKKILDVENVEHVIIPTESGEIDVLPEHAPLLSTLSAGSIRHSIPGGQAGEQVMVTYGIVEVAENHVKIFSETAETASQIDSARARDAQKRAEETLKKELDPSDIRKVQLKLFRALERLKCSAGSGSRG